MKWGKVKVGDCCEVTSSKRIFFSEYVDSGVPFYRSKEIIESSNGQAISEPLFISQEKYDEIKNHFGVPQPGDMLLTSVGTIGVPYIVREKDYFYFKDGNLTWFRNFSDELDSKYLYFWVKSSEGQSVLNNTTIGSSQKALTIASLKGLEIPCPPAPVQKRIVEILAGYDDLIENNQKQIKLLEEAAQRLYKEWFIDLRFPGHETTPIVDGVPEGWKVDRADTFFNMSIGKTPPRAEKQWFTDGDKGTPWISISDMGNSGTYVFHSTEGLTAEAISKHNVRVVPADTILVSFKLTVGRVSITTTNTCTNEAIAHFLIPDGFLREYTYLYLKCFEYDSLGNTSAISKAVNSKIIKAMPFVMPDSEILQRFHQVGKPILEEIKNKQKTNIYLAEARDRLLPKLMSGEIEV
ncbi:MAG: restriction endonuclease subunit S [Oscillibacter sp.]|nr:restriction endonuclease subunit S [Oscillibacter sp.]